MGFSAGGAEYSEIRVLEVDSRKLLPESMYPSYGAIGWTMVNGSFFYDAGKVIDIKSPEIEFSPESSSQRCKRRARVVSPLC